MKALSVTGISPSYRATQIVNRGARDFPAALGNCSLGHSSLCICTMILFALCVDIKTHYFPRVPPGKQAIEAPGLC